MDLECWVTWWRSHLEVSCTSPKFQGPVSFWVWSNPSSPFPCWAHKNFHGKRKSFYWGPMSIVREVCWEQAIIPNCYQFWVVEEWFIVACWYEMKPQPHNELNTRRHQPNLIGVSFRRGKVMTLIFVQILQDTSDRLPSW